MNDELLIEQAKNTSYREMEPIYWIIEDSLEDNKKEKAEILLLFMSYVAKYNPDVFKQGLQTNFIKRLKTISYEINAGFSLNKQESVTIKPSIFTSELPFKNEAELKSYIIANSTIVQKSIGLDVKITGRELVLPHDYRVDIVAENQNTLFAVEVKMSTATHAVVSQCDKYCYYLYRQLRYDRFKNVQGIVMSPGFDDWSINELRRKGHWLYLIRNSDDPLIKLERIN